MRLNDIGLVVRADAFADYAHRGQLRAYTGEPYINHPRAVNRLLRSFTRDQELLAAALLHDVREMTDTSAEELVENFGEGVALLVDEVTDSSTPAMGNRAARKEHEANRLAKVSRNGKSLKLADTLENASTIAERDPKFARVWLGEKALLLPRLVGGHPTLHSITSKVVNGALLKVTTASLDAERRAAPPRRR